MIWIETLVAATAIAVSGARWIRIAQREHYLAGSVTRFMVRWWRSSPVNIAAIAIAAIALFAFPAGASVIAVLAPVGLSPRGKTSKLAWTPRLRRLVGGGVALAAVVVWIVPAAVWLLPILGPIVVDFALRALKPLEERLGRRWVEQASTILSRSGSRIVAITGSYGKTSTKGYLKALLEGATSVLASPASFNNRMGLARAVNEHLLPGTDVFIAEMGTYGPGEITALCEWMTPDVAVIIAVGPVHLERMGSEEAIATAKREILVRARVGVVNVDNPLLAVIASEEAEMRKIITCSARDRTADVVADESTGQVIVSGEVVGRFEPDVVLAGNLACAVGAASALGFDPKPLLSAVELPVAPHRLSVSRSDAGFAILDDTFNSNPAGTRVALGMLVGLAGDGRRVLVTPGMVELGKRQASENEAFAAEAARIGCQILAIGRTNRRALKKGGGDAVIVFATRPEAVAWVRANLGPGDAVLYENDLPDHYA